MEFLVPTEFRLGRHLDQAKSAQSASDPSEFGCAIFSMKISLAKISVLTTTSVPSVSPVVEKKISRLEA